MKIFLISAAFMMLTQLPIEAQDDLRLFDFWEFYSDAENCMYKTSCALGFEQLKHRQSDIAKLRTMDDFRPGRFWLRKS